MPTKQVAPVYPPAAARHKIEAVVPVMSWVAIPFRFSLEEKPRGA